MKGFHQSFAGHSTHNKELPFFSVHTSFEGIQAISGSSKLVVAYRVKNNTTERTIFLYFKMGAFKCTKLQLNGSVQELKIKLILTMLWNGYDYVSRRPIDSGVPHWYTEVSTTHWVLQWWSENHWPPSRYLASEARWRESMAVKTTGDFTNMTNVILTVETSATNRIRV